VDVKPEREDTHMASKPNPSLRWQGVAVVLIATAAVVVIALTAMDKYADPKEVVAVLGAVVSPLIALGAAAFGIKWGADAKAETKDVRRQAGYIANKLREARGGERLEVRGGEGRAGAVSGPLDEIEVELRRLSE